MIQPTPIHSAALIAAKLRLRDRWALILTVTMIVSFTVLGFLFLFRPTPPRARSRAERDQLLRSGICIVRDSNGALIGKLIDQFGPSKFHARTAYLIEDARVRTTRTVDVSGTRREPCSSIREP
jgi:hypothetical protein